MDDPEIGRTWQASHGAEPGERRWRWPRNAHRGQYRTADARRHLSDLTVRGMVAMGASLVRLVGATHRSHGDFRVFSPDAGAAGSSSASSRVPCHHRGNGTWRTPCAAIRFLTSN